MTWREIPGFELLTCLNTGGLPHIYGSPDAAEELDSYVSLYLQEEMQAEALTRTIRDGIPIYPWADFLRRLWIGEMV